MEKFRTFSCKKRLSPKSHLFLVRPWFELFYAFEIAKTQHIILSVSW